MDKSKINKIIKLGIVREVVATQDRMRARKFIPEDIKDEELSLIGLADNLS